MSTDKRLMDLRTGRITCGDEPCINCPHDLNAHNSGVDGPAAMPFSDEEPAPCRLIGGESTLPQFLDFMSGYDPDRSTMVGEVEGEPIYEYWDQHYSEHDVIRALIAEIRRQRTAEL